MERLKFILVKNDNSFFQVHLPGLKSPKYGNFWGIIIYMVSMGSASVIFSHAVNSVNSLIAITENPNCKISSIVGG